MIVVDASLAAKWVLWEAHSDAALDFWETHVGDLAAPDLIAVEVASALVRRANMDKSLTEAMREGLMHWSRLMAGTGIQQFRVTPPRVQRAADLAMTLGHPVKDCLYLDLAAELDCPLITCDVKFAAKARGVYAAVRVLGE